MAGGRRQAGARRARAGFTLLEVLVALVIVGTAVTSMLHLMSGSISNLRRVDAAGETLLNARRQMNHLLLHEQPELLVSAGGRAALPGRQAGRWDDLGRWEATARPLREEAAAGSVVPVRVVLDIWWRRDAAGAERHFQLETIQLRRLPRPGASL